MVTRNDFMEICDEMNIPNHSEIEGPGWSHFYRPPGYHGIEGVYIQLEKHRDGKRWLSSNMIPLSEINRMNEKQAKDAIEAAKEFIEEDFELSALE